MKVVLIHYSAPPIVGGVEGVIGHHARLMADAGHDVRIIAGRGEQTDPRVRFVQVPMVDSRHPVVTRLKQQLDQGSIPDEFNDCVDELTGILVDAVADADCLIAHNVCSLNKNLILTTALMHCSEQLTQLRLILWHHDLAWTTPRYRSELHDGHPWDLLRTAWPGAEQVVVSEVRKHELASLMGIAAEGIKVIPNGVDVARFLKLETLTSSLMEGLDLLNARPLLLLPARITPRKNIELALQVLAAIHDTNPRAMLIITGPLGPHNAANTEYLKKLQSLRKSLALEGSAIFLVERVPEFLPDEVVSDFYKLVDGLFLPSHEEGFGIPVVEAGLAGIPIFCADIPPLRDLGLAFANYFSPDGSPPEIASMVLEKLSSSPVFGFRVHVRSQFDWHQIYWKQIDVLLQKGDK